MGKIGLSFKSNIWFLLLTRVLLQVNTPAHNDCRQLSNWSPWSPYRYQCTSIIPSWVLASTVSWKPFIAVIFMQHELVLSSHFFVYRFIYTIARLLIDVHMPFCMCIWQASLLIFKGIHNCNYTGRSFTYISSGVLIILTTCSFTDLEFGEWVSQPDNSKLRDIKYTLSLNYSFGPKFSPSTEHQVYCVQRLMYHVIASSSQIYSKDGQMGLKHIVNTEVSIQRCI